MKNISILGSTGSIGKQTLEVVRENSDKFNIIGLTCNKNIDLLLKQIKEFKPDYVSVMNKEKFHEIKKIVNKDVRVYSGLEGLKKISISDKTELLLTAVVGSVGLIPTYEAVKLGKDIALANKETLVIAGEIIINEAKKTGSNILPVDSEHNAIFQCLNGERKKDIEKIILTASGGSFLNYSLKELKDVTIDEALDHPNWSMGKKITIDSATMMNKGLEVIEAKWLFNLSYDQIDVIIHPESIIHSMVQYIDGSVIAQMGLPDMKLPISYSLNYPERLVNSNKRMDLSKISKLNFIEVDFERFKALKLAYKALKVGGTLPVVLNKANEIYVDKYLKGEIDFLDIIDLVEKEMLEHNVIQAPTLEEILDVEEEVKRKILR